MFLVKGRHMAGYFKFETSMYRAEKIADMCIPCHKVPLTFLAAVTIPAELPEEKVETTHTAPCTPKEKNSNTKKTHQHY